MITSNSCNIRVKRMEAVTTLTGRKKALQNSALVLAAMLFVLFVLEAVLQLAPSGLSNIYQGYPQGDVCLPDGRFGWIGKPNTSETLSFHSKDMDSMHVQINDEGFWDDAHEIKKPKGVKRLLFLGDSFTSGYGVDRPYRFTDLVGKRIAPHHEVINMGMWGFGTDQQLLVLKEKGLKYSPDVVVLSLFLDDLFTGHLYSVNDGLYFKPKYSLTKNGDLFLKNFPVAKDYRQIKLLNLVQRRWYKLKNRMEIGKEFYQRNWFSVFDKDYMKKDGFYLSLRLLAEIQRILNAHGIKLLVVIIPYKIQMLEEEIYASKTGLYGIPANRLDMRQPQKIVGFFCRRIKIPVLDLLPVFQKQSVSEKLFFTDDLHWTAAGHRLAARHILQRLPLYIQ